MAIHHLTGKRGEVLAACWLTVQGYQILFKNWRHGRGEIDIIAKKKDVLHFIEVKTSRSTRYGFPEDRMSRAKWRSILLASQGFLDGFPVESPVQFDVIAVLIGDQCVEYHLMEDAFSWMHT
jgi:putative endonuclease